MKSKKQRKAVLRLPTNFKERVVQAELNLETDNNDSKAIQQLMTLYTVSMTNCSWERITTDPSKTKSCMSTTKINIWPFSKKTS